MAIGAGGVTGLGAIEGPDGTAPPIPPLRPGDPPLVILVDYDGTIAQTDVSDTVMAEPTIRSTSFRSILTLR